VITVGAAENVRSHNTANGGKDAAGNDGFALQRIALDLNESMFSDYSLPDRGFLKGEALQQFVNKTVQNRPLEKLNRIVAVVATDLQSGEAVAFQRGDTGMAVRASSAVPGVFQPVRINGRDYVDGGVVSPVPVKIARRLGADIVIASDISAKPSLRPIEGTLDILLQTFTIMANTIAAEELSGADVVVKPDITSSSDRFPEPPSRCSRGRTGGTGGHRAAASETRGARGASARRSCPTDAWRAHGPVQRHYRTALIC
jgi:predicted acylesterase/phospholipase RssA